MSFIGVLDIFGFEHFSKNSFEQICINYANEKLQDHFNFAIFKSEKEVYEEEGIAWTFKDYPDNSERLELFEHKSLGIFALCDENLKIPKPSDEKLVKALYAKCSSHSFFGANKSDQVKSEFVVKHFACDVKYQITGFLEKNKNEIAQEVQELFDSSNVQVVKSFALDESSLGKNSATSGKHVKNRPGMSVGKKTTSLSAQFSKQLSDLISRIRTTRSWFVRCIKSNNQLQSKVFDTDIVIQQLRCGGALGAVQVFRAGFPNRMDFAYFVTRYITFIIVCGMNPLTRDLYQCITKARITGSEKLWRIGASKLIDVVSLTSTMLNIIENVSFPEDVEVLSGLQMGKTQVFLRAPVFEFLERLHTRSVTLIARRMQRRRKATMLTKKGISKASYSAIQSIMYFSDFKRRKAMKVVASTIFLQRIIRVYLAVCLRRRVVRGATILKAHFRGYKARSYVRNLKRLAATKIQSNYRCYSLRKRFCSYKKAVLLLQNNVRVWKAIKLKEHMVECILLMQKVWRGTRVRILLWKYRIKKKLDMEEARKKDAEVKAQFQELLERQIAMNPSFLDDIQDASMKITQLNDRVMHLTLENNALTQENQLLHSRINELLKQLNSAAEPVLSMNTQGELNDPINRLKQEIDLNLKNSCFDNAGYCIGLMETNHHLLVTGLTSGAEKIVSEVDGEGQVGAKCNSLQVRYPPVEVTIKSLRSESSILLGQTTAFEGEQSFNIEHQQLEVGKVEAATVDLMQNELKSLQESYCHHQQLQHLKLEESDSLNPSIDKLIKSLVVAEEALTKHQVSIEIINDTKDGLEIGLQQKEFELRSKMKELYDSKIQIAALNIIVTDLNSKNKELRGYLDKEITNWNQEFTTVKLAVNFCMEKNSLLVESLHSMEISRKALEDLNEARLELIQNLEIENRKLLSDISLLKRSSISTLEGYDHGLNKSYSISTNNLQLQAEVISWMRIDDGDVMYTISVGVNGVEWNTLKSYEHFRTLRSIIGNDLDPELDMEFPPIVFSLFNLNDNEAETRRYMLHRYLTGLISSKKLMGRNNVYQAVLDFLGADTGEA